MQWKVLSSSTKTWSWGSWAPSIKTTNDASFLTGSFLITNSFNIDISDNNRSCSTVDLFSVVQYMQHIQTFLPYSWRVLSFKKQYFNLMCHRQLQNLLKHLKWSVLLKSVKSFQKKTLDIWVLNKPLLVSSDCNMYYFWKVTLKIY